MMRSGRCGFVIVGVAAALTAATVAGADVRTAADHGRRTEHARISRPASSRAAGPAARRAVVRRAPRRATLRPAPRGHRYAREIAEASARYAVPARLIWAVIRVESGFDPRAVSRSGARGLMQLMPETAAILGVRDPFDPRQNIDAGTRHLRAMMEIFRNDVRLAVAAYNAGPRPVVLHRGVPPYPETRQYVSQVLRLYDGPERVELRRGGVRRIVQPGGVVVYTNLAYGGLGAPAR